MSRLLLPTLLLALLGLTSGCGSGDDADTNPGALEAAFKDAADTPADSAPPPQAEESTTDSIVIPVTPSGEVPVKELAAKAAGAMRKDDLTEAMVLLQTLRRARNLSPQQLTAVQDQMAALQADVARKAEEGDPKAKQAMQLIQQSTRW